MSEGKDLVGRLEIEPIRKAFPKEATHFTTWLAEHIEVLAERLGMKLSVVQREKPVGPFNVDLECEDGEGRRVIIENQLEATDHDHLGKILTYLVNLDAAAAVWVTSDPRPEHQKVVDWLNESTPVSLAFYLVKAECVRIGDSPVVAPLFTVVAAPSTESKITGDEKKHWADRGVKRLEFWRGLIERSKGKTPLFANISPGRSNWIATGAGRSNISFAYVVLLQSAAIELYIDYDQTTGEQNKKIFDELHARKDDVEREYGGPLVWQRLDDKRACRISVGIPGGGLMTDPEGWPALQDKMIDAMVRFHKALKLRLDKIQV